MPYYLVQAAYTPEAWAAQLKNPRDRREAVKPLMEKLGGRLESLYYAFGEYDIVAIIEGPDNIAAAATALTVTASGQFRSFRTTPLMTVEDGIAAMRKAAEASAVFQPATA
jgi:uncharacterized protein with GYD domain